MKSLSLYLFVFLFFFSFHAFAFQIDSVEINCEGKENCLRGDETFKSLNRNFVDIQHFKSIIKIYSLTTGVDKFRYKIFRNSQKNHLVIHWVPKKILRTVEYDFAKDSLSVPSLLPLKEGEFFDEEKVSKTIKLLKELYSSKGYSKTRIKCDQKNSSDGTVDLKCHIDLGKPINVSKLTIVSKSELIKKLIRQKLSPFVGKPLDTQAAKEEVDDLEKVLIEQGYFHISLPLRINIENDKASFFITSKNLSIHSFSISSDGKVSVSDEPFLNLKLKLKEATIIAKRDLTAQRIKEIVYNSFKKKGFLSVKVTVDKKVLINHRKEKFVQNIVRVSKGKIVRLTDVDFKGNNVIKTSKLKQLFYEKASDQVSSGIFDEDYYKNFLDVIREEYIKLGFVNVFLEPPEIDLFTSSNTAKVKFRIRERVRAKIHKISISGVSNDLKIQVAKILNYNIGDAFNPIKFKTSIEKIKSYLREEGYYFSELISEKVNKLVAYNKDNTKVFINIDFDLGQKYFAGEVIIIGNYKTKSKVIERELLFAYDSVLKASAITGSQTKVLSTGLFSSVNIRVVRNSSAQADILISVKEKDYGLIEIAPGIRNDLGPKVSFKVSYNNIDGLHKQLSFNGQVNRRVNLNSLDKERRENEANLLEYRTSVNYTENYFFDFPVTFTSSISTSRQRFFFFDADIQKINYTLGSDLNRFINLSLTQELEVISQYNATNENDDGRFQIGSITPSITLDFRNNRINPTSGSFFTLSTEFANPTFFSQSNDEIVINYYKFISRNRFYIPFKNGVFALSVAGGVQKNLATDRVKDSSGGTRTEGYIPNIKLFRLAGMDNVRGFEDDEINRISTGADISATRVDDTAYMFNLKVEPRVFLSDSTMLGVFYDAGRVFVDEYDFSELRSSIGLSFKYLTPVGSLDFDYGIKLLRKKTSSGRLESPGRLHVSIGFF